MKLHLLIHIHNSNLIIFGNEVNSDPVIDETMICATPLPFTKTGGNVPHNLSI